MASSELLILDQDEAREYSFSPMTRRNSGIKVARAIASKNMWNVLMCRAVEGANALSDIIKLEYSLGLISISKSSSKTRIAHTTLSTEVNKKQLGDYMRCPQEEHKNIYLHSNNCNLSLKTRMEKC